MQKALVAAAICLLVVSAGSRAAPSTKYQDPLPVTTLTAIRAQFGELMDLANKHDDAVRAVCARLLFVHRDGGPLAGGNGGSTQEVD
jgi:hypothetical protein